MNGLDMETILWGFALGTLILCFWGVPFWVWTIVGAKACWLLGADTVGWTVFGVIAVVWNVRPIRTVLLSTPLAKLMKGMGFLPQISETEKAALKAGNVWAEAELFSGKPSFKRLMSESYPELTAEEKAFIAGPVRELCLATDDWKIWQTREIPQAVWDIIKKHKFLGMIIPKEYGGLGFSALAHSEVIQQLSGRSVPIAITVMVPNSLGPAELLNHYGTDAQKNHYLPRLARGEDIPCFALTEPGAGSDASSIQATGVVFKGSDGKLYLKLNWDKRWITLAAISTVLGLAFRLKDPENLLGKAVPGTTPADGDLGITCALIPSHTPGVVLGRRHDPLGVPFYNCPTQGKDVVAPIDVIIGGVDYAGKGWNMLMESLAAGRGISIPAQGNATAQGVLRIGSAFAVVRKQFGVSIGDFEGIAEPLARLGGRAYFLEATRKYTLGAIDAGIKPPVVTAIAKYQFSDIQRKVLADGMDIMGGAGISCGPRNIIAHSYFAAPISITVEGANILTRTLIIFGQGALRAHPYAFKEVDALEAGHMGAFDKAFWAHVGYVIRNTTRSMVLSLTRGWAAVMPFGLGVASYYRKLSWASATFAFLADFTMAGLGGKLKFKEKITGRFADVLSWMYIATATLRRYEYEGRRREDWPLVEWSLRHAFTQMQEGFDGLYANFEFPMLSWLFRGPVRLWAHINRFCAPPSDALDLKVARLVQVPGAQRDRLTEGFFLDGTNEPGPGLLEYAMKLSVQSQVIQSKVRKAVKAKKIPKKSGPELVQEAVKAGVISKEEADLMSQAEEARRKAIAVDSYTLDEYLKRT